MENMTTAELLGYGHFFQTNDAGGVDAHTVSRNCEVDVREFLKLCDQSSRLVKELNWFPEFDKRVNTLTEKIKWKLPSHKNPKEELSIENKNNGVKYKSGNIKNITFLDPLFPIVQLHSRKLILEVMLNAFKE